MLIILSTPIGNLSDISVRAINVLKDAKVIACEDTRVTKKLLSLLNISLSCKFISYNDHNGEKVRPKLLKILKNEQVILMSDAGTPLISDPGYKLVKACYKKEIPITAIPGPSSPIVALTLSGLPTNKFVFNGFVPIKPSVIRKQFSLSASLEMTQIWFEVPRRLITTLEIMLEIYGNRNCCVLRELTKLHEEKIHGSIKDLIYKYSSSKIIRGEIVIIIEGVNNNSDFDKKRIEKELQKLLQFQKLNDAAREVANNHGYKKNDVYKIGLKLKQELKYK